MSVSHKRRLYLLAHRLQIDVGSRWLYHAQWTSLRRAPWLTMRCCGYESMAAGIVLLYQLTHVCCVCTACKAAVGPRYGHFKPSRVCRDRNRGVSSAHVLSVGLLWLLSLCSLRDVPPQIRKLEQSLKKEVETGRTPRGSIARAGRDYAKVFELLSRASAAAVTFISMENDKNASIRAKREKMLADQRERRRRGLR